MYKFDYYIPIVKVPLFMCFIGRECILDKHAPLQHKMMRSNKVPWMTSDIKKLMNTRDNFKRKTILTNNENDWLNFKTTRNKVNIELRNAKKDYYSSKIAD